MENNPVRSNDELLVFRPAGHGALLENLSDINGDIICIKNIDNVVPDHLKSQTYTYKKGRRSMNTTLHALEFPDIPNVLSGNSITHMAASLKCLQL